MNAAAARTAAVTSMVFSPFVRFCGYGLKDDDECGSRKNSSSGNTSSDQHGVFSFRFLCGIPCPRRHAYNSTSRTKIVRDVIFNMRFVIFDIRHELYGGTHENA